jgi:hypothetical protein
LSSTILYHLPEPSQQFEILSAVGQNCVAVVLRYTFRVFGFKAIIAKNIFRSKYVLMAREDAAY